jgi:transcription antitermination factor NusG
MARKTLTPENVKEHVRELQQDQPRKQKAMDEVRKNFRGYVESNFELNDRQRAELERTPKLHGLAGQACAIALENGWPIDLVLKQKSPNLSVEGYCNVSGECGVRVTCNF